MTELNLLRQKHTSFIYDRCTFEVAGSDIVAKFFYTLEPDIHFTTELRFRNIDAQRWATLDQELIKNWLLAIGMVEGFSYWKAACPQKFVVKAGYFSAEQITFWHDLLLKGMSEFFFINHINAWEENFIEFVIEAEEKKYALDGREHNARTLVPLSGGKDSIVTLELLKQMQEKLAVFTINPSSLVQQMVKTAETSEWIQVSRTLDPQLLKLNKEGYLNGHTPFSAMVAFVITLSAYVYDFSNVALSNEFSANEGNTTFLGQSINHQYSKTFDFEGKFRDYCSRYLSRTIKYFSFLRPLHEIQIAKLFAKYPQYFSLFLSCNRGAKEGKWCGECPKCLFVAIMLSPFLSAEQILNIYHQDILNKECLVPILNELTGMVECKSFECVGTRQETTAALALTIQKYNGKKLPFLLQYAKENILVGDEEYTAQAEQLLESFQTHHFLPEKFAQFLQSKI